MRKEVKGKTRALIRFVRTKENYEQWPVFKKYWQSYIDLDLKDDVVMHDVHNWGKGSVNKEHREIVNTYCPDLFSKIVVYSDGRMALCCADDNGMFNFENVVEKDPIEIFNGEIFQRYRELMSI